MFFGDGYPGDVHAPAQNPNWDSIAILEELILYYPEEYKAIESDSPLSPIDPDLYTTSKFWSNYFTQGTPVKKNYFVN